MAKAKTPNVFLPATQFPNMPPEIEVVVQGVHTPAEAVEKVCKEFNIKLGQLFRIEEIVVDQKLLSAREWKGVIKFKPVEDK